MNRIRTSLLVALQALALLGLPAAADDGSDHTLTTNITINHFNGHGLFSPHPNNCDPDDEVFIEVEHIEADGTEATGFCVERTVRPAATW